MLCYTYDQPGRHDSRACVPEQRHNVHSAPHERSGYFAHAVPESASSRGVAQRALQLHLLTPPPHCLGLNGGGAQELILVYYGHHLARFLWMSKDSLTRDPERNTESSRRAVATLIPGISTLVAL